MLLALAAAACLLPADGLDYFTGTVSDTYMRAKPFARGLFSLRLPSQLYAASESMRRDAGAKSARCVLSCSCVNTLCHYRRYMAAEMPHYATDSAC